MITFTKAECLRGTRIYISFIYKNVKYVLCPKHHYISNPARPKKANVEKRAKKTPQKMYKPKYRKNSKK